MSLPELTLLPFEDLNPFPKVLDTPRFHPLWDKWIDHRKAYKRPKRGWDKFFQEQLEWLAEFGEEAAFKAVEVSYHNGWQGLFPERYAARPELPQPRKPIIPDWRVEQLLREELVHLNNELQYDFDLKAKPAMVHRRNIVKAQLAALTEKMKG